MSILTNIVNAVKRSFENKYNQASFSWIGGGYTQYDPNNTTYLEKGFNKNPDVYSCINQMATKTVAVPYCIKKVNDKKAFNRYKSFQNATKGLTDIRQDLKLALIKNTAFESEEMSWPLEQPNPLQTWADIIYLYKTYMKLTGNCYFYMVSPEEGANKGTPILMYVLPSHLTQIVLKPKADLLSIESPIDYYMLIEGNQFIQFKEEDVIHVKYPNPNFDLQGSHLYGMSPMRAILRNINSENSAIDNNIKTLQNSGAFGFIYGKNEAWTSEQAQSMKEKLILMDNSPERMGKIAGASGEVGFQRISLTTDELRPFDFLAYDQKMICNALSWSTRLLNENNTGALAGSDISDVLKQVVVNNILPDLVLLQEAWNKHFISRFKGYENSYLEFDITELPEMQKDMAQMVDWLDKIPITPNEFRTAMKYQTLDDDGMDVVLVNSGKKRIDDLSDETFSEANDPKR